MVHMNLRRYETRIVIASPVAERQGYVLRVAVVTVGSYDVVRCHITHDLVGRSS